MLQIVPTAHQLQRLQQAFAELKAENDSLLRTATERAFVHTRVFRAAQDHFRCLLIGRKGSGKTALLLGHESENASRYLTSASVAIRADDFPLEPLFHFFYADFTRAAKAAHEVTHRVTDLGVFSDPVRISAHAWANCLRCSAVFVGANSLLGLGRSLSAEETAILKKGRNAIASHMGLRVRQRTAEASATEVVFSLLVYFFQAAQAVIDKALGAHTAELAVVLAAATRRLTSYLSKKLDSRITAAARVLHRVLGQDQRQILLTLDKFDDFYDEFYRRTTSAPDREARRHFLADLMHGLVLASRDLVRDPTYSWVDVLFTIPMDKFLELHLREREDLEQAHVLRLEWTPRELLEYANRRIAYALDLPDEQRHQAWKQLFDFDVTNGTVKEVKEDSFLYVVRHSLWKPREIQMYISAVLREMAETRLPADEAMFRRVVKRESEKIIRREFLEEFQSEYPGLLELIKRLEDLQLKTVMTYSDLCDKLGTVRLFREPVSTSEVALRLFYMGVLGVRQVYQAERRQATPKTVTQQREEVAYVYCFNSDSRDPFDEARRVVFHPMFFEFLNVKHSEEYVVNELRWDMFPEEPAGASEGHG